MIDLERQIRDYYDRIIIPVTTDEYTELATGRATPGRPRRAWALAAAFLVVLVGVGATLLLLRGNDGEFVDQPQTMTVPSTPSGNDPGPSSETAAIAATPDGEATSGSTSTVPVSEAVFSWDRDALGEWVTEAELTGALRDVLGIDDRAILESESGGDDWNWTFGDWRVNVHDGDHDGRYAGPPPETDSRLPQGVTFEREWGFGWGHWIFSGMKSDEMISIWLLPPGTGFGYPRGSEIVAHEEVLFPLASWMLHEMGWVNSPGDALPTPTTELELVPIMETKQILYGAGDISCPQHWAHDQSLPVGSVGFEAGEGMFTVVVELIAAAPDSEYGVEVWEPETCLGGPLLFEGSRALTTDETGAGRIEFTVVDVDPGSYRLNVNVVHNDWEDRFPDVDDTRLWEIGGAGFSLVEVLPLANE